MLNSIPAGCDKITDSQAETSQYARGLCGNAECSRVHTEVGMVTVRSRERVAHAAWCVAAAYLWADAQVGMTNSHPLFRLRTADSQGIHRCPRIFHVAGIPLPSTPSGVLRGAIVLSHCPSYASAGYPPVPLAMSFGELSTTATDMIPLSTDFCADNADIVIRAAGTLDFRAHKLILSFASPIFKDMFTLPQPPPDTPGDLPRVDVQDSAKAWKAILQTIYPFLPNPIVDTLDDLESLLSAARRYEMKPVIEIHKKAFEHREFIEKDPLRLYTLACACGFEDQATYVARNAELLTITRRPEPGDLSTLTFEAYRRLVSFLVDRDNRWNQTFGSARAPYCPYCNSQSGSPESLYNDIKKLLQRPCLQSEEVYLKALEFRSRYGTSGCIDGKCSFGNLKIKEFIDGWIGKREKVCDEFQPAKWYCEHTATFRPNPSN